jgi:hypothetical protein
MPPLQKMDRQPLSDRQITSWSANQIAYCLRGRGNNLFSAYPPVLGASAVGPSIFHIFLRLA